MTVIQPIFYGGVGGNGGDVRLKSLSASVSSLILAKNQSADLQITPVVDLSKAELYEASCDDPRVKIERQDNHGWHIVTPDEKFPKTTQTVVHFRAIDDSGVSVDVPLTLQAGLNPSEAHEWFTSHAQPKALSSSFEPLPGWKPFESFHSGAEIIARAIREDKRYMVNVGDYFDETVDGTTYRWTIAEFNHYGRGEALMVPDKLMPGTGTFASSDNTYSGSNLESRFNAFYNAMPASLKPYVLNMSLPWTNYTGSTKYLSEYVFPPSEIEAFGTTHYSQEPSGTYRQWPCFTDNSSRIRSNQWYWLRSTHAYDSDRLPVVASDGSYNWHYYNGSGGALPCFCLG